MALWIVDVYFFKQKTAYEVRISDWSSDVCSSDLAAAAGAAGREERLALLEQDRRRHRADRPLAGRDRIGGAADQPIRSVERRVGKECVRTFSTWWSPYH